MEKVGSQFLSLRHYSIANPIHPDLSAKIPFDFKGSFSTRRARNSHVPVRYF